nr:MAG TPA: hypothetical protein [Caudoviricetes sp.]
MSRSIETAVSTRLFTTSAVATVGVVSLSSSSDARRRHLLPTSFQRFLSLSILSLLSFSECL